MDLPFPNCRRNLCGPPPVGSVCSPRQSFIDVLTPACQAFKSAETALAVEGVRGAAGTVGESRYPPALFTNYGDQFLLMLAERIFKVCRILGYPTFERFSIDCQDSTGSLYCIKQFDHGHSKISKYPFDPLVPCSSLLSDMAFSNGSEFSPEDSLFSK